MRPINLKIKGLNSFIDVQEINFEDLAQKGLFGIFGPTGSGKSTILDGITLALYGEVSRKSTNYMNTNCNTMSVSYEFQISDKDIKKYRVERQFKRDNKTANVVTKSAIILDITDGERVLEDKTRNVTKRCEEIIGLKLEDFTRTVVLPQGKFSEFLKLEGRDRREMLERLFNLQKYGDNLSNKLGARIREENQKSNILEGQLNTYKDVSQELLEEKNNLLKESIKDLERCKEEVKRAEEAYNQGKEIWDLQKEFKELKRREEALRREEAEINLTKEKLALGESALKIKPYVDGYENTLQQIAAVRTELEVLYKKAEVIRENKKEAEANYLKAKEKKDTDLPLLRIKDQQVMEALEEKKVLDSLIRDRDALKTDLIQLEEKLYALNKDYDATGKNIENLGSEISLKEARAESLKVAEEFKNKVNDGFIILSQCEAIQNLLTDLEKDIKARKTILEEAKTRSEKISLLLKEKDEGLLKVKNDLKNLIEKCPGDQDSLLALKEKLTYVKEKWDKHKEYLSFIEKSKEQAQDIKRNLENKDLNKGLILGEISKLKDEIQRLETENLAHVLRESLKDGEICPVCGSRDHHMENIVTLDQRDSLEKLREDLRDREENFEKLSAAIIQYKERLAGEEKIINDNSLKLDNLGQEYKNSSPEALKEEFNLLYDALTRYNSQKTDLEKSIQTLSEEKNQLLLEYTNANNLLHHNKEVLKKLQADKEARTSDLKEAEGKLSLLKQEIEVDDFKSVRNDIDKKEKEKTSLEKDIKELRNKLGQEQDLKDRQTFDLNDLKIQLKEKKTLLLEKAKNIEEKELSIKSKAGDTENLQRLKSEISKSIKDIDLVFEACEKKKSEIEEAFQEVNNQTISFQGNLLSLQERCVEDKSKLDKALAEEGIMDLEEAKKNFLTKAEMVDMKSKIDKFNDESAQLKGAIINLNKKINQRSLSEDEWKALQRIKEEKTLILEMLQKTITGIEVEIKAMSAKIQAKKVLLKEKEDLDYKLALLSDLEKLFRGKKFVEFVAANQLKYVSLEASKKLKEITGGSYGLEVDENGKFLIRDYKNGGALRDASTLSGGETFVASLALALALSSQIQLKGTAPLELFFLDEGFGSLDDNLLDVVMDSLERIHHSRLSIGIISHVESIKNRVPVKLIVSPAVAGLGGSRVKIEKS